MPRGGSWVGPARAGWRRRLRWVWAPVAVVAPFAVLWVWGGDRLEASLAAFPPGAVALAVGAHVATLACRCEAWRMAVNAIGGGAAGRACVHAASGAGFVAGAVQGASTAPVRALTLRRLSPASAPPLEHALVAEAPVVVVDAAITAVVLAFAVGSASIAPPWVAPVAMLASLGLLAGMRLAVVRTGEHRFAAGLRVLDDPVRLAWLTVLIGGTTVFGLFRVWLALAGFGLPHDPASVSALFVAQGLFGLLPIGSGATPGATLAVFGAADPAAAAAAGIALSGTSLAAVGVYGGAVAGAVALSRRPSRWRVRLPRGAASWEAPRPQKAARQSTAELVHPAGRRATWTTRSGARPSPVP
jgi:hypothetical protein